MTLLVHWLWLGLAVTLVVAGALRCLPQLDARTRHGVWWAALGAVLALPLVLAAAWAWEPSPVRAVPAAGTPVAAGGPLDVHAALLVLPSPPDWIVTLALAAWAVSVLVGLVRIALGVSLVARLKRAAVPLPAEVSGRLRLWPATAGGRTCALLTSRAVRGACALGWRRPAVVVSTHLVAVLDAEDLDRVVAHECAHLARRDDWTQLLQVLVTTLAGWHPAVRLIAARIDLEREAACDARVAAATRAPREYAACLARVGALVIDMAPPGRHALLSHVARARRTLSVRVERLLAAPTGVRGGRLAATILAGALALIAAGALRVGPLVAFETGEVTEPSVASPGTPARAAAAAAVTVPVTTLETVRQAMAGPARRRPAAVARAATSSDERSSVPGEQIVQLVSDVPAPPAEPPPLELRAREAGKVVAPMISPVRGSADFVGPAPGPWSGAVRAGRAVAAGGQRAGTATGSFFMRAATGLAASFKPPADSPKPQAPSRQPD